jgi:hypothetical protein
MKAMEIPDKLDDITPAWLTEALGTTAPGIVVDSAQIVDVIHGACTKVRLSLRTNRNYFPSTVLMKAGFEAHSPAMRPMHDNEYHAYRDLIPTPEVNSPHCHFAGLAEDGRAMVILEDLCLRDVHFLSLQAPIGFELAKRFLEGLARIHARWWDAADRGPPMDWIHRADADHMKHYFDILADEAEFNSYVYSPRGAAMPRMLLDRHLVRSAHDRMREFHAAMPKTVNHGDMHLGNLYTDADGTPGYLDYQPCYGPWSIDVSYFLIAGLDLVDRRRWQGALLQHYLTCLAGFGVAAPTFDEAWAAYRRDVVWGLTIWMMNGSNFQSEANNTASATRFAMAMIDLDTLGALGMGCPA